MRQILYLAFAPRRLGISVRIGATVHDAGNACAKLAADLAQARQAALVFHRIVQQRGNHRVFVATVFDHNRGHAEQVADVRPLGALAFLFGVQTRGVADRSRKSWGKLAFFGACQAHRDLRRVLICGYAAC